MCWYTIGRDIGINSGIDIYVGIGSSSDIGIGTVLGIDLGIGTMPSTVPQDMHMSKPWGLAASSFQTMFSRMS